MATESELLAIVNTLLASGQPTKITATKHRQVESAIISELYNAQSRANLLASLTEVLSFMTDDKLIIIRNGVAKLIDKSLLQSGGGGGGSSSATEDVTGTTYEFTAGDNGKLKVFTNVLGCTANVPTGLPDDWSVSCYVQQGAGDVTVTSDDTYEGSETVAQENGSFGLFKKDDDTIVGIFGSNEGWAKSGTTTLDDSVTIDGNGHDIGLDNGLLIFRLDYDDNQFYFDGSGGAKALFKFLSGGSFEVQTSGSSFVLGNTSLMIDVDTLKITGIPENVNTHILYYNPVDGSISYEEAPSGGAGATNLGATLSSSQVVITSDTGTDATIPAVDSTNAGVVTPTQKASWDAKASQSDVASAVAGLLDYRGVFDASGGAYPTSAAGGSGSAGAILKSDFWVVSVAGTLPTGQVVEAGDLLIAKQDTPGNTQANWAIVQNNIGYVPLNKAGDTMSGNLAMGSNKITGLAAGTASSDALRFDQVVGVQDLYYPASGMWSTVTNGCAALARTEIATSLVNIQTLDFDPVTQEFCQFTIVLPRKYNNGTITAVFYWTAAGGSGTVQWGISGGAYSDDDALSTALGTAQTSTDTLITANDVHVSPETSPITIAGTPADADFIAFQISRNPASDTLNVDAKLIGVSLRITTDAGKDA